MKASWEAAVYAIEIGLNRCSLLNNLARWIAMPFRCTSDIHERPDVLLAVRWSWGQRCLLGLLFSVQKQVPNVRLFVCRVIILAAFCSYFVQCCKHVSCHRDFIRLSCVPFRQILMRLWPFLFRHKSSRKRTDHPFRRVGVWEKRQERITGEIVPQFPISKWNVCVWIGKNKGEIKKQKAMKCFKKLGEASKLSSCSWTCYLWANIFD